MPSRLLSTGLGTALGVALAAGCAGSVGVASPGSAPVGVHRAAQLPAQVPDRSSALAVLEPADGDGPLPTAAGLSAALDPVLAQPAVGRRVGVAVADAATGRMLHSVAPDRGRIPASTTKLLTGAAALTTLDPAGRLTTRVVRGPRPRSIVLVGGGDPTLTRVTVRRQARGYPQPARLTDLATSTAEALRRAGTTSVRLRIDDSLFRGPVVSSDWKPTYVSAGVVGPVTALTADGGRLLPDGRTRLPDPAVSTGESFAELLEADGVRVTGRVRRTTAAADARQLTSVSSPPVAALVETMLASSDNDVAEALARHVALAEGEPPTFAGGAAAVAAALERLGLDTAGLTLRDGSGLARANRVSPRLLTTLLSRAADPDEPRLRRLLSALPVAGFTGTLAHRYDAPPAIRGAGLVRAKTGTLLKVSALAGTVLDADGRLLAFALLAEASPDVLAAERVLDRAATALARCGCR